jgi:hypothetical protein
VVVLDQNLKEPYASCEGLIDVGERQFLRIPAVTSWKSDSVVPDYIICMRNTVAEVVHEGNLKQLG